ncbi:MAG TPA: ABC transporter permease [Candidatus Fournierella merdavium]|uniref:ABC transporter permease n=1 Tax=Candidatus Allofournierella merdavium TaxID=2838593 RepID=UPI001F933556|nr:ABC transporter permease [Candidatus Fournierella merdavium]
MSVVPESDKQAAVEQRIAMVQKKKRQEKRTYLLLSILGIAVFLGVWELASDLNLVNSRYLAAPSTILKLFFTKLTDPNPDGAVLGVNVLASLQVSLTGFFLAIIIGIPLGLLMGWYGGFESFVRPIFELVRPIPPVSWIPLTIVWLGIGLPAKAFIVFFSAFVPCVINAYTGIKQTSPVLINFAKTCGASNFTTFWRIGIPSSMTMVFAGVRVALGNAWATLVAAEMLAASSGLGYMILMGRQFARPDLILLGIVVIGVIGVIFTAILGWVENKVLGWKK